MPSLYILNIPLRKLYLYEINTELFMKHTCKYMKIVIKSKSIKQI